jgi:hypothetical protein
VRLDQLLELASGHGSCFALPKQGAGRAWAWRLPCASRAPRGSKRTSSIFGCARAAVSLAGRTPPTAAPSPAPRSPRLVPTRPVTLSIRRRRSPLSPCVHSHPSFLSSFRLAARPLAPSRRRGPPCTSDLFQRFASSRSARHRAPGTTAHTFAALPRHRSALQLSAALRQASARPSDGLLRWHRAAGLA